LNKNQFGVYFIYFWPERYTTILIRRQFSKNDRSIQGTTLKTLKELHSTFLSLDRTKLTCS